MSKGPIEDLLDGYLQHRRMETTASYVSRGRVHAQLPDADLQAQWAQAYRAWVADLAATTDLEAFGAELSLRGQPEPLHLVEAEHAWLAKQLKSRLEAVDLEAIDEDNPVVDAMLDYANAKKK